MNLQSFFQVNAGTRDLTLLLQDAFLPSMNIFSNITGGKIEMDFIICEDGSLCMKRITSTNADLYYYFRRKLTTLRLTGSYVEFNRVYTLRASFFS